MVHTSFQFGPEVGIVNLARLEVYLILECGPLTDGDLLIELLLAHPVLFLEGEETVHIECDVREGDYIRTVPGILAMEGVYRETHLLPGLAERDIGTELVLQCLIDIVSIVSVV